MTFNPTQNKCKIKRRQRGLSLVELMVSMVIALLVLIGASLMFLSALRSNADNISIMRLNQDLRNTMQYIARDIRRAGFINGIQTRCLGNTGGNYTNYCEPVLKGSKVAIVGNNISYFYDAPGAAPRTTTPSGADYDFMIEGSPLRAKLSLADAAQRMTDSNITITGATQANGIVNITVSGSVILQNGDNYQRQLTQQIYMRNHLQ